MLFFSCFLFFLLFFITNIAQVSLQVSIDGFCEQFFKISVYFQYILIITDCLSYTWKSSTVGKHFWSPVWFRVVFPIQWLCSFNSVCLGNMLLCFILSVCFFDQALCKYFRLFFKSFRVVHIRFVCHTCENETLCLRISGCFDV